MVRWIAFDDDTAEAVVCRLRRGAAEIQQNAPVDAALRTEGTAVLVLPSSTPGKLLVARFRPRMNAQPPAASDPERTTSPRPSPPSRKPVVSAKRPWWRKIVA